MDWPTKIEELKAELQCNTTELTRMLNLEGKYIADIERGRSKNPSTSFIISLLKLGVNPMWLFLDEAGVLLQGEHFESKMEVLKKENKELKQKLGESGVDISDVMSLLNELVRLKRKDQEKAIKYVRSLETKK